MCIIAVKPASKEMFKDSVIKQMFLRNRDGAGVMWTENETVHFKKGFMTVRDVLDFIHSRNWDGVPVVLHFRIGTAGPNNKLNCHPYPIWQENRLEGECDLCMAHNGILSKYDPPVGSKINDTQEFVNKALSNLPEGFLESKGIRHLIQKVIGTSRLCFLSKTGKITRFGKWVEDDGYFFSNESYKTQKHIQSSCVSPRTTKVQLSFSSRFKTSCLRSGDVYKVCKFANSIDYKSAFAELRKKCRHCGIKSFYNAPEHYYDVYTDGKFNYVCVTDEHSILRYLWF